jgi:hypothetical protein
MKKLMKDVGLAGYILVVGTVVMLLAVAASASAVWGS